MSKSDAKTAIIGGGLRREYFNVVQVVQHNDEFLIGLEDIDPYIFIPLLSEKYTLLNMETLFKTPKKVKCQGMESVKALAERFKSNKLCQMRKYKHPAIVFAPQFFRREQFLMTHLYTAASLAPGKMVCVRNLYGAVGMNVPYRNIVIVVNQAVGDHINPEGFSNAQKQRALYKHSKRGLPLFNKERKKGDYSKAVVLTRQMKVTP